MTQIFGATLALAKIREQQLNNHGAEWRPVWAAKHVDQCDICQRQTRFAFRKWIIDTQYAGNAWAYFNAGGR